MVRYKRLSASACTGAVTLSDVAREAGVSATVSRVLNSARGAVAISAATREAVLARQGAGTAPT